jgi:cbb3-type cytochrome oxidase maturation protein
MEVLVYLVPLALMLGLLGLSAFLWSLKTGQYDDLDGAAWRAIIDDDASVAAVDRPVDRPAERRSNEAVG